MPKSRMILSIGVVIALLPVLGFPHSWEAFFQVVAGLSIVILSVWATIDKKLKLQAKAQQRQARKDLPVSEPVPPIVPELVKRVTDFYPKTGQQGRRLTDLKSTYEPPRDAEEPEL